MSYKIFQVNFPVIIVKGAGGQLHINLKLKYTDVSEPDLKEGVNLL